MKETKPTGIYWEDFTKFSPDDIVQHPRSYKITAENNKLFSRAIGENQPLHYDYEFASKTIFGEIIINGNQTKAVVESMTVPELTHGTIVANLETTDVKTPHPVKLGDELVVVTKVLGTKETSKNKSGIVFLEHNAFNQNGVEVLSEKRVVLVCTEKLV